MFLTRSEPAKKSGQNIPKNRCRTTIAERIVETPAELPFIGDQVVCLSHDQAVESPGGISPVVESLRLTVAGTVGTTALIVRCRHVKQLTDMRDVFDTPAIGEQTVVTDAVETIGQDACARHTPDCGRWGYRRGSGPDSVARRESPAAIEDLLGAGAVIHHLDLSSAAKAIRARCCWPPSTGSERRY
jgi:hypothetical protein